MRSSSITQMPLRVPQSLHEALKAAADAEGVSLNQYCLYLLARDAKTQSEEFSKRGEDLLKFISEAQLLQAELDKGARDLKRGKPHG